MTHSQLLQVLLNRLSAPVCQIAVAINILAGVHPVSIPTNWFSTGPHSSYGFSDEPSPIFNHSDCNGNSVEIITTARHETVARINVYYINMRKDISKMCSSCRNVFWTDEENDGEIFFFWFWNVQRRRRCALPKTYLLVNQLPLIP